MRIIKQIADDIACNIDEAEQKIETAYTIKANNQAEAVWYKEMAVAHLNFNQRAHELVAAQIGVYRNSDEYKTHPEYADGMMAVWNDKHADLVRKTARVKAMIDTFK